MCGRRRRARARALSKLEEIREAGVVTGDGERDREVVLPGAQGRVEGARAGVIPKKGATKAHADRVHRCMKNRPPMAAMDGEWVYRGCAGYCGDR